MFSRLLQSKSKQSCVAVGENHSPFKICALNAHFVTLQNDDVVRDAGYGRLGIEYGANISIMPLHLPAWKKRHKIILLINLNEDEQHDTVLPQTIFFSKCN